MSAGFLEEGASPPRSTMRLAGITKETVDAPGARIERDGSGRPIGLCREYRKLIEKVIPPPTLEERKGAALRAQGEALRYGVTGVHTCETLAEWDALAALEAEGRAMGWEAAVAAASASATT